MNLISLRLAAHIARMLAELLPEQCDCILLIRDTESGQCDVMSDMVPRQVQELFNAMATTEPADVEFIRRDH